jgi:hypothetical protein
MLLRNKPILKYSGLTIVMSNPSRFDITNRRLLSAGGGSLLQDHCLQPEFNLMQCDIRVMEDKSPFLEGTRCLLLLGESAMHDWCTSTRDNTLNELRGSPLESRGLPAIASYFPQDAADFKNYESKFNEESKEFHTDEEGSDEDDEGDVKRLSPTKRSNYPFWLKADVAKCKGIIKNGLEFYTCSSEIPIPKYYIYPPSDEVINILTQTKDAIIDFDIETDVQEQNLQCFSFSVDGGNNIYCVPVLDNDYHWAYSNLHFILRSLSIAAANNTLVAHNGAAFDFFVLGYKYHIPVKKPYDTMLTAHRIYPDIEKSLGHITSLWTWLPFHKDEDSLGYFTRDQMMKRLAYNGKDVFAMAQCRKAMTKFARTIPGLEASIDVAQRSILPYLVTMLQGIRYDLSELEKVKKENDLLMNQYLRCIHLLIGEGGMEDIRKVIRSGKAKAFPNSNAQCCEYFHNMLGYPVLQRGKPNKLTGMQKPSLGKKTMYRLAIRYPDNPVIRFVLAFRELSKEYSSLKFTPWKDDYGKIYIEPTDTTQANLFFS